MHTLVKPFRALISSFKLCLEANVVGSIGENMDVNIRPLLMLLQLHSVPAEVSKGQPQVKHNTVIQIRS